MRVSENCKENYGSKTEIRLSYVRGWSQTGEVDKCLCEGLKDDVGNCGVCLVSFVGNSAALVRLDDEN